MTQHKIIMGDARDMREVQAESAHLVITSPPYWQLKDYGDDRQIGFHHNYEDYINHLSLVWQECHRVLQKGCRLCVNIGEQFARGVYYGRYKIISIHTEIIKSCEALGFDYMGAIICQKNTTMNTTGGATIMGSFPHPRNGIVKLDYEFILIFKKQGAAPKPTKAQKDASAMTKEEWNTFFNGHWYFSGARQDQHLAMFPEELPRRLIKMFSFVGDTVLDPFLGSGTTSVAAMNLGRNSVGYEINAEFEMMIENRLKKSASAGDTVEIFHPKQAAKDFSKAIEALPYRFDDPHRLDKRMDVKKRQFGSKIDKTSGERETYFTVSQVLSPELVELNDGSVIKLLGIKTDTSQNGKAVEFLREKTKGQKVYLRFENKKPDRQNRRHAYLYLQNRTFLNAHLIKKGLAKVDNEADFKYRDKFNRYAHGEK